CLTPRRAEYGKQIRKKYEAGEVSERRKNIQQLEPRTDSKTNCLTTVHKDNLIVFSGTICGFGGRHFRKIKTDKSCTLMARARNDGSTQPCVQIDTMIRRLTPTECARLQTIPDWYKWECSDTQQYRMLGNGWTVDVIAHILSFIKDKLNINVV
ncbi:DNA cytosine methyltransferase, partial [Phocaeicola vulgatus]|nr:DNA cytosine methyltransferase [Phocaeicola vulgatus]